MFTDSFKYKNKIIWFIDTLLCDSQQFDDEINELTSLFLSYFLVLSIIVERFLLLHALCLTFVLFFSSTKCVILSLNVYVINSLLCFQHLLQNVSKYAQFYDDNGTTMLTKLKKFSPQQTLFEMQNPTVVFRYHEPSSKSFSQLHKTSSKTSMLWQPVPKSQKRKIVIPTLTPSTSGWVAFLFLVLWQPSFLSVVGDLEEGRSARSRSSRWDRGCGCVHPLRIHGVQPEWACESESWNPLLESFLSGQCLTQPRTIWRNCSTASLLSWKFSMRPLSNEGISVRLWRPRTTCVWSRCPTGQDLEPCSTCDKEW